MHLNAKVRAICIVRIAIVDRSAAVGYKNSEKWEKERSIYNGWFCRPMAIWKRPLVKFYKPMVVITQNSVSEYFTSK